MTGLAIQGSGRGAPASCYADGTERVWTAVMGHDWVFDTLTDLRSYAMLNGLTALAAKAEETLETARAEIASRQNPLSPEHHARD